MKHEKYEVFNNLFIGACATFSHDFFIAPSDVIKQRMQLCKNLTARESIGNIMKDDGIKGLYRSYPITVFMNLPFMAIVVCVNENMKTWLRPWETKNPHHWYFLCAGIAGGCAALATNPIDVVKTRLQTQNLKPSCSRLVKLWKRELDIKNNIEAAEPIIKEKPTLSKKPCFEEKKIHYSSIF